MLQEQFEGLLQELAQNGYKYCILGGEGLPERFLGSDIDILINKLDKKVSDIFSKHGFIASRGVQCFTGSPVVFCKYVKGTGWIPLHIIEKKFYGHSLVPDDFCRYTVIKDSIYYASDELYVAIITVHGLIKGNLSEKRVRKIVNKIQSGTFSIDRCSKIFDEIGGEYQDVCKGLLHSGYSGVHTIVQSQGKKKMAISEYVKAKYLKQKMRPRRTGVIVALEGIDGSGKTTFIGALNSSLPKEGRTLFCTSSMAGRGYSPMVRRVRSLWRISCDRQGVLPSIVKNGLLPVILLLEVFNSYSLYLKALRRSAQGYNTIFDRYCYLHYIRQMVHNKSDFLLKRAYLSLLFILLIKTFPAPDMILYLDIDPGLAFQRKKEDTSDELEMKRDLYETILKELEGKTVVKRYPASRPPEETVSEYLAEYWPYLV